MFFYIDHEGCHPLVVVVTGVERPLLAVVEIQLAVVQGAQHVDRWFVQPSPADVRGEWEVIGFDSLADALDVPGDELTLLDWFPAEVVVDDPAHVGRVDRQRTLPVDRRRSAGGDGSSDDVAGS